MLNSLTLLQAPTSTHVPSLAGLRNRHSIRNPTGRGTSPPSACRPRATPAPKTPLPVALSRVAALPGSHPPKPASPTRSPTASGRPPAVGGGESQGVPLLASCLVRIWACAFADRASFLLNTYRLREQVYGRWKEVTSPGPPRGTPPRCIATRQDAGFCQVRGARRSQRRRRPSRPKSPRWRSSERSIATYPTPSRAHDRPDRATHLPQRGDQRWRARRGRTRGHVRMQIGLRTKGRQTRASTPQPRPASHA